ncbi:MAG: hypothetical protein AAB869_03605, partial [Patescibacteria group bacterium]
KESREAERNKEWWLTPFMERNKEWWLTPFMCVCVTPFMCASRSLKITQFLEAIMADRELHRILGACDHRKVHDVCVAELAMKLRFATHTETGEHPPLRRLVYIAHATRSNE